MTKNAETALRALFFPFIVFLFHMSAMIFVDAYFMIKWFDNPMHFLGGLAIGLGMAEIFRELQARKYVKKGAPAGFLIFFVVAGTSLVAVLWEFHEFLLDKLFFTRQQMSISDTMGDLALGISGAFFVSLLVLFFMRKKS